jgi:aminomethyltransferase
MDTSGNLAGMYFYPRIRKTPYHEATLRYGCRSFTVYNHMYHPIAYTNPVDEYGRLCNDVTLWDVAVERILEITGPDAFRFANYLTPRDLTKCAVGQCKYVVLVDQDGGIVNDPVFLRLGRNHCWLALADSDALLWAKGVAVHSKMRVRLGEPDVSPLQVQGPKSKFVVRDLFGPRIADMPYYHFARTNLDGMPLVVSRTGWSGEIGYEVYLQDGGRGDELWERIMAAGRPYDIAVIAPSEIRRIEAGILNYQADMTLENNPYEVGLGWLIDEGKKADYIGKKALARIRRKGPKRKLVGVEIEGEPVPGESQHNEGRWPVLRDGKRIGYVPDAVYSPRLKKNIGYANVPIELAKLGTRLSVVVPDGGERRMIVVRKPFVDPSKDIPKS